MHAGIIGGVAAMSDFQVKFFPGVYRSIHILHEDANSAYCKYNDQILQLVVSSLYIAAAAAALVTGPFARKYGRKVRMCMLICREPVECVVLPQENFPLCSGLCLCRDAIEGPSYSGLNK